MILYCAIPMVWAAIMDFKKRIIPDWTWITILLIGGVSAFFFKTPYLPLLDRIVGFLLPAASLLIIAIKYCGVGGGDIKLMSALGFYFGIYGLMAILLFAAIPACIYSLVTKQRSVPLAVFLCAGYFIYVILSFLLMGGGD